MVFATYHYCKSIQLDRIRQDPFVDYGQILLLNLCGECFNRVVSRYIHGTSCG